MGYCCKATDTNLKQKLTGGVLALPGDTDTAAVLGDAAGSMEGAIKLNGMQMGPSLVGTADGSATSADLVAAEISEVCGTRLAKPVAGADAGADVAANVTAAAAAVSASALGAAVDTVADSDKATSTAPLSVNSASVVCPSSVGQFAVAPGAGAVTVLSRRHVRKAAAWGVELCNRLAAEA